MPTPKIQSHQDLKEQMLAVARGERKAPKDANAPSFDSVAALTRLLTPENRQLMAVIRDRKPESVAELAELTSRAAPNVTRTLAKLEAMGLVKLEKVNRRKVPTVLVKKLTVEIDPYSADDRVYLA